MSPDNLSLKVKLLGGFLAISTLVLAVSLIGISTSAKLIQLFEDIVHIDYPKYNTLLSIRNTTNEIRNQTLILTLGDTHSELSTEKVDSQKNEILANVEKIHTGIDFYKQNTGHDETGTGAKLNTISRITDDVIDSAFSMIALREQQSSASAVIAAEEKLNENQRTLQAYIDEVIEKELVNIEEEDRIGEQTVSQTTINIYIISFMAVILAIAGGFSLSIPIVAKIRRLRNAASEVAKGNLDVRLNDKSHDELGQLSQSFDQMTQKLKEVSSEKEKNAIELQKKSEELAVRMSETERINKFMLGRELKMIELKNEIKKLQDQLGQKHE